MEEKKVIAANIRKKKKKKNKRSIATCKHQVTRACIQGHEACRKRYLHHKNWKDPLNTMLNNVRERHHHKAVDQASLKISLFK